MMDEKVKQTTITANFEALEAILHEANIRTSEAVAAIKQGNVNLAIGTAIGVDEMLKQATALYGAAIAIHRA